MRVRGLPGHIIRSAGEAARLISAKSPNDETATKRDVVRRWRQAIKDGLSANAAAQAVGVPRATLYRWEIQPEPKSRTPHRMREPMWGLTVIVTAMTGLTARPSMTGRLVTQLLVRARNRPPPDEVERSG